VNHKPECNEKWEHDKEHCICNWIEKAEQRIIKLLEELDDEEWMGINQNFIALIKGENK
jgi:hypothetical protein